jgi:hypothetical protein
MSDNRTNQNELIKKIITEATQYRDQGDHEKALELFDVANQLSPDTKDILYFCAVECNVLNQADRLVDFASRLVILEPENPFYQNTLGVGLLNLKKLNPAIARFKEATRLKEDFLDAMINLGNALLRKEKCSEAILVLEKALPLDEKNVDINLLLSQGFIHIDWHILGNYYYALAEMYGFEPKYREKTVHKHTFFVDKAKAYRIALQGNRTPTTEAVDSLQMCYFLGTTPPDAPNNLIGVEVSSFVDWFTETRFMQPEIIGFDTHSKEQRELARQLAVLCRKALRKHQERVGELKEICQTIKPEFIPGEPLRVLFLASRMTTVMQYNSRDLAQGFRNMGSQVEFYIEADDREQMNTIHFCKKVIEFKPHVMVHINHLNNNFMHQDCFNITWWQDLMPLIQEGKPLPWMERDFIYSFDQKLDGYLKQCGAKDVRRQEFCYEETLFNNKNTKRKRKRKAIIIASSYSQRIKKMSRTNDILPEMIVHFEAGEPMTDERLAYFSKISGEKADRILLYFWTYVVRDYSVRWLCELSDEMGVEVEVYGRYWDKDKVVKPFFKGELAHGSSVAEAYNDALYSLTPHSFDLGSQRLSEATACGTIPIIYDCRHRTKKISWEKSALWYRTKEDLRACLSQIPEEPIEKVCEGRSYTHFADKILTRIDECLAETKTGI